MTLRVSVYGFGSAFNGKGEVRDVDLLVVHPSINLAACGLAIACKSGLSERIRHAHITMLSAAEEEYFKFIDIANAVRIGTVRNGQFEDDLDSIIARIKELAVNQVDFL